MKQAGYPLQLQTAAKTVLPFDIHAIQRIEEQRQKEAHASCSRDHFVIIWVTKGDGEYSCGQERLPIVNNQLLFIKPGQFHNVLLNDNAEGYIISFTASFLEAEDKDTEPVYGVLYQIFAHNKVIAGNSDILDDMLGVTQIMLKEFKRHNLYRTEVLRRYLKIFLLYLSRLVEMPAALPKQTRNDEILRNFMCLLERNFRTQKMVADYAGMLFVTPNYLNEVIKKTTGKSAGHHIRQIVALEAKKQASSSNSCLKSIAYDLGFLDLAHFSKFFKNATGVNFSDFKRSAAFSSAN